MKRKVDVRLLGRRFTVKTEKDEAYVHALASQVSRRLDEIRRQVRGASVEEQALLVAMYLADELSEERERSASLRMEVRSKTQALVDKLAAALNGAGAAEDGAQDGDDDVSVVLAPLSRQN